MKNYPGLEIRGQGIYIVYDSRGKQSGEAFVQFTNPEDTEKALKKNREKIGHRSVDNTKQKPNQINLCKTPRWVLFTH